MGEKHTLSFGWMSDPLSTQLSRQGLTFDAEVVAHLERDAEAISRLRVRSVITGSEGDRAYDRLAKRVWKEVRAHAGKVHLTEAKAAPPLPREAGE